VGRRDAVRTDLVRRVSAGLQASPGGGVWLPFGCGGQGGHDDGYDQTGLQQGLARVNPHDGIDREARDEQQSCRQEVVATHDPDVHAGYDDH
jgi:hypothetical protein